MVMEIKIYMNQRRVFNSCKSIFFINSLIINKNEKYNKICILFSNILQTSCFIFKKFTNFALYFCIGIL